MPIASRPLHSYSTLTATLSLWLALLCATHHALASPKHSTHTDGERNRLTASTDGLGSPSLAGRLQRLTHPGEVRSEVSRDGAGRVTGIAHRLGAGLLLLLGCTLDANGHRVAEVWERSGERVETSYQLDLAETFDIRTRDEDIQ